MITCSELTARDSKRKAAVDCVVGSLVNDCFIELNRFVKQIVPVELQTKHKTNIECALYSLRDVFLEKHISNDLYRLHNTSFAMSESSVQATQIRHVDSCGYLAPFTVSDFLRPRRWFF